jgi:hypothetical protein
MTKHKTKDTYLVLGVDQNAMGRIAIVTNAEDPEAAQRAYRRRFKIITPISWPALSDLHESVRLLELARDGLPIGRDDVEVLDAGASAPGRPPNIPNPGLDEKGVVCPGAVVKTLDAIRGAAIERGFDDPFEDGGMISTPAFDARAYRWEPPTRGAFWWRDVRVTWYKHLGRDCRINRSMSSDEIEEMRDECFAAIALLETEEV